MTVWVVRQSLDGETVGAPRLLEKPGRVVRVPGILTIDEQIAMILADGEAAQDLGVFGRWKTVEGTQPTGFIEILDAHDGRDAP